MRSNKSFSTETSERYSRALFEVSQESSELDKAEGDLKNFLSILASSSDIENTSKKLHIYLGARFWGSLATEISRSQG